MFEPAIEDDELIPFLLFNIEAHIVDAVVSKKTDTFVSGLFHRICSDYRYAVKRHPIAL
jgi:hypothetical protein